MEKLAWMAGDWRSDDTGGWSEEHWLPPRGGVMLGMNRSGQGDVARSFEFLRIARGTDGTPVYWAAPGGRAPTPFRLTAADGQSATFENLENPFPARIRYRREGNRMTATIEAADGSKPMSWTWHRR